MSSSKFGMMLVEVDNMPCFFFKVDDLSERKSVILLILLLLPLPIEWHSSDVKNETKSSTCLDHVEQNIPTLLPPLVMPKPQENILYSSY